MIDAIFERFVKASPINVMVRAILERIFEPTALDKLFDRTAQKQHTRDLLFSTIGGMMIALPASVWRSFIQMSPVQFALTLQDWTAFVNLKRFSSSPRGP